MKDTQYLETHCEKVSNGQKCLFVFTQVSCRINFTSTINVSASTDRDLSAGGRHNTILHTNLRFCRPLRKTCKYSSSNSNHIGVVTRKNVHQRQKGLLLLNNKSFDFVLLSIKAKNVKILEPAKIITQNNICIAYACAKM